MDQRHTQISKFLSYVLRHRPDEIDIQLDGQGWVSISGLLAACADHGQSVTREQLDYVVANNEKRRFAISVDGSSIRASQGHSTVVDLGYEASLPPEALYHGTSTRFLPLIRQEGLVKGARQHVHLSIDRSTAQAVGRRHGAPFVFLVRAAEMARAGMEFYLSANGVWLTEHVPARYLEDVTPGD